jgi:hypothetical protein
MGNPVKCSQIRGIPDVMGRYVAFVDLIHCSPNDDHAKHLASGEWHPGKASFSVVQDGFFDPICLVMGRARNGPGAMFPGGQWLLSGDQAWHMIRP